MCHLLLPVAILAMNRTNSEYWAGEHIMLQTLAACDTSNNADPLSLPVSPVPETAYAQCLRHNVAVGGSGELDQVLQLWKTDYGRSLQESAGQILHHVCNCHGRSQVTQCLAIPAKILRCSALRVTFWEPVGLLHNLRHLIWGVGQPTALLSKPQMLKIRA